MGPFQGHPLNQKEILSYSNQLALIRTTSSFCGRGEGVDARNGGGCGGGQGGAHGGGLVEEMEEGLVEDLEGLLEEFGEGSGGSQCY